MNFRLLAAGLVLALSACSGDPEVVSRGAAATPALATQAGTDAGDRVSRSQAPASFASLPDKGSLTAYVPAPPRREGPSTWHRVEVSEAHALRAAATGTLRMAMPGGRIVDYGYKRHIEHPDGNWSWVGSVPGNDRERMVITFGERAAFGTFWRADGPPLQLTMRDGVSWMVERDPSALRGADADGGPDYLVPPRTVRGASMQASPTVAGATASSTPTVDLVVGYTSGFATGLGGQSQAVTRITHLVTLTNEAYSNSGLAAQVRLVRTVQVNYADATDNNQALYQLSGSDGGASVSVPSSLQPIREAREQAGGDLVSLVRKFSEPENEGCGVAWLIGGGGTSFTSNDAPWGYSVVSDGSDGGYYCREETLAHELGHNMGQNHNQEDAGDPGVHAYSYGYRESSSTGFFTIMAYRITDSSQYSVPYFANPAVTVQGRPTGVTNVSDNVRSMAQTIPIAANFRASATTFADVPTSHWAYSYIERLYDAGITGGCATSPRQFCPSSPALRDEMAVFLLRSKHGSAYVPPAASGYFGDVPTTYWAASWIERLRTEGISGGCSASPPLYCPRQAVTREQMAVFLLKAKYGSNYIPPKATGVFEDVPVTHWAAAWIEKLAADGVTGGCTTTPKRFCPASTVTRDQMAVFLVRNFGL